MRLGVVGGAVAGRQRRRQQHGQMRLGQVAALRPIGQRQAEEPGKAQGFGIGGDPFQRAPEHLGPHVDAEHRLQGRTCGGRARCGQLRDQPALIGAFGCLLQDRVDHLVGRRLQGPGMVPNDACPALDQVGGMGQQRLLPDQADRQQVGQRGVGAARLFGLPGQPARMLRPAPQIDQQPVKRRRGGIGRQAQAGRGAQDGPVGRVGRGGDMRAEPPQSGDFGGQVVDRPFPPRRKGAQAGGRRPQRLPLIEPARGPQPDAAGDDLGPVDAVAACGQIGQRRQRPGRGGRGVQAQLQRGQIHRLQRRGAGDQRRRQVVVADAAGGDQGANVFARTDRRQARDAGQPGGGLGQVVVGLAQERADGHGCRQGKGRRDRGRGGRRGA